MKKFSEIELKTKKAIEKEQEWLLEESLRELEKVMESIAHFCYIHKIDRDRDQFFEYRFEHLDFDEDMVYHGTSYQSSKKFYSRIPRFGNQLHVLSKYKHNEFLKETLNEEFSCWFETRKKFWIFGAKNTSLIICLRSKKKE